MRIDEEVKEKKLQVIKEIRCTCNECGKTWHYLPHEAIIEKGKAISNFGKNMMQASACCGNPAGCCGAAMPRDKVRDLGQCPQCGSRNTTKEEVTYEKPSN